VDIDSEVARLDTFMKSQPKGQWILDDDYWKRNPVSLKQDETYYFWIDRRIEQSGDIHTGNSRIGDPPCQFDWYGIKTTYNSLDDMIKTELRSGHQIH